MRDIRKTGQGGSVASFVIIGIILSALLIGSIYFVKQRGDQARRQQAIAEYDQQQADKKRAESETKNESTTVVDDSSDEVVESALPAENLPNTGPESSVFDIIGVFLLTVSIFSYFSSKRYLPRYL